MNGWTYNNKIPFCIRLLTGKFAVVVLMFKRGSVQITYKFKTKDEKLNIYCYRSAKDAKLAARMNSWTYLGE